MRVTKCDICKKPIKSREEEINAGLGSKFSPYEFCLKCGKPIYQFLKKHGFIENPQSKKTRKKR